MSPAQPGQACSLSAGTCLTNCVLMGVVLAAADILQVRLGADLAVLPAGPIAGGASFPPPALCPPMAVIVWLNVVYWATLVGGLYLASLLLPDKIRPRAWVCTSCTLLAFFCLALNCELALRDLAFERVTSFRFWPDATLYWTFNPAADGPGQFKGSGSINSAGFRGLEIRPTREAGEFRILCLGESITACAELRDCETYPSRLRSHLQKAFPNLHIVVQNCGVPGYSLLQGATVLDRLLPSFQPDLVIVGHIHCNLETLDADYQIPFSHRSPMVEIRSELFSSYLFLFVKQQIAGTPQVGLGLTDPDAHSLPPPERRAQEAAVFRSTLERLVGTAHDHGFKLVFLRPCMTVHASKNAAIPGEVARDRQVPYIDLNARWSQRRDLEALLPDKVHMNAKAAALAGHDIGQFLIEQGLISEKSAR